MNTAQGSQERLRNIKPQTLSPTASNVTDSKTSNLRNTLMPVGRAVPQPLKCSNRFGEHSTVSHSRIAPLETSPPNSSPPDTEALRNMKHSVIPLSPDSLWHKVPHPPTSADGYIVRRNLNAPFSLARAHLFSLVNTQGSVPKQGAFKTIKKPLSPVYPSVKKTANS